MRERTCSTSTTESQWNVDDLWRLSPSWDDSATTHEQYLWHFSEWSTPSWHVLGKIWHHQNKITAIQTMADQCTTQCVVSYCQRQEKKLHQLKCYKWENVVSAFQKKTILLTKFVIIMTGYLPSNSWEWKNSTADWCNELHRWLNKNRIYLKPACFLGSVCLPLSQMMLKNRKIWKTKQHTEI